MGLFLLAIPFAAALSNMIFKRRRFEHISSILSSVLLLAVAARITREVMLLGKVEYSALFGVLYIDSMSIIVLDIVVIIGFIACVHSVGYLEKEIKHGTLDSAKLRLYYILMHAFIFTMVLALTVKNIGIMWVAIEATTLASVFLVGFNNDKFALEAAWKYIIICSVGIVIALLGIILLHYSSIGVLNSNQFLDWVALYNNATALKSAIVRLAFIFILIGFGTKAGLAPMHTWLPDAHSQAPAPISALLSGVLLNSAMYGIIRTVAVVNRNLGSGDYTGRLMIAFGVLSIATAAVFILTQKDYKKLLAYSSIEHMGVVAIGVGLFTPLSVFGALLHMINHSLTKSMLFLTAGNILQKFNTKYISKVKGIFKLLPVSGSVFLLGLIAIAGVPPFSVFSSELAVISSSFQSNKLLLGAAVILLLAIVFAGIILTAFKMFSGKPDDYLIPGESNIAGNICLVALLAVITVTGLYMPDGVINLIVQAQSIITGG